MNDSPVTVGLLERLGDHLVEIHGQHEHQRLLEPARQLDLLDRFGDAEELPRARGDILATASRRARPRSSALRAAERDRAQREDLLRFQLSELDGARLREGEEDELRAERRRLAARRAADRGARRGRRAARRGRELGGDAGCTRAGRLLRELARLDPAFAAPADTIDGAGALIEDALGGRARSSASGVAVDARASGGGRRASRRAHAAQAEIRRYRSGDARLPGGGGRRARAARSRTRRSWPRRRGRSPSFDARARAEPRSRCRSAGARRRDRLAGEAERELRQLGMDRACFAIAVEPGPMAGRRAARPRPRRVSPVGQSGRGRAAAGQGGVGRRALAHHAGAQGGPGARRPRAHDDLRRGRRGIGGRVAAVVAQKLARAAEGRQVLCVTHLAPIAARATHHVRCGSGVRAGRTRVSAEVLTGERARRGGRAHGREASGSRDTARGHARELLTRPGPRTRQV